MILHISCHSFLWLFPFYRQINQGSKSFNNSLSIKTVMPFSLYVFFRRFQCWLCFVMLWSRILIYFYKWLSDRMLLFTCYCSEFKEQCLDVKKQHVPQPWFTQPTQAVYTPCKNNCLIHLHLHCPVLLSRSSSGCQWIANMSSYGRNKVARPVFWEVTIRDKGSQVERRETKIHPPASAIWTNAQPHLKDVTGADGHREAFLWREV